MAVYCIDHIYVVWQFRLVEQTHFFIAYTTPAFLCYCARGPFFEDTPRGSPPPWAPAFSEEAAPGTVTLYHTKC